MSGEETHTVHGKSRLLKTVRGTVLVLAGTVMVCAAFLAAWRHVRGSPELVDGWPGGAIGFGLSCGVAVLLAASGALRGLRRVRSSGRGPARFLIPLTVGCVALGLLSGVYGLAVVPPRWCHESLSPACESLPGAAEGGLAFQGTLIAAFFLHGAFSTIAFAPAGRSTTRGGREPLESAE